MIKKFVLLVLLLAVLNVQELTHAINVDLTSLYLMVMNASLTVLMEPEITSKLENVTNAAFQTVKNAQKMEIV
jgi:hypothetical protein